MRCPTLHDALRIINGSQFPNVTCFIIHCGTNDLEKETDTTVQTLTQNIITQIQNKFPKTRVILSSLLPRKDTLNQKVTLVNNNIKKAVADKTQVSFVSHHNICPQDLKDSKHLTQQSVKFFAKNLKAAYFNTSPRKTSRMRTTLPTFQQQRKPYPPAYPYPSISPFSKIPQSFPPNPATDHRLNPPNHYPHTSHFPEMSKKSPTNPSTNCLPNSPHHGIPPHLTNLLKELSRWIN
jgi:hypothetical protein